MSQVNETNNAKGKTMNATKEMGLKVTEHFYEVITESCTVQWEVGEGLFLVPDGWGNGTHITANTDWLPADYRVITPNTQSNIPLNVKVTGRSIRRIPGMDGMKGVRVQITFVHDGEPDTTHTGWLELDSKRSKVITP